MTKSCYIITSAASSRARSQNPSLSVILSALKAGRFGGVGCFGVGGVFFAFYLQTLTFCAVQGWADETGNQGAGNLRVLFSRSNVWPGTD